MTQNIYYLISKTIKMAQESEPSQIPPKLAAGLPGHDTMQAQENKYSTIENRIINFFLTIPLFKYFFQFVWINHLSYSLKTLPPEKALVKLSNISIPEKEWQLKNSISHLYITHFEKAIQMPYSKEKSLMFSSISFPDCIKESDHFLNTCEELFKNAIITLIKDAESMGKRQIDQNQDGFADFIKARDAAINDVQFNQKVIAIYKYYPLKYSILYMRDGKPIWGTEHTL